MAEPDITLREAFHPRGLGYPRAFPVRTPAPGGSILLEVPSRVLWRILGFQATFTADATAATRTHNVRLQKDGFVFWSSPAPTTVTATQVANLVLTSSHFAETTALLNDRVALPDPCYLAERMQLVTVTTNIQATDQWSAAEVWVMEWLEM